MNLTALMQLTPTFSEPFHRIVLDIVGPLLKTKFKSMFITYIDMATKYLDEWPLKTTTSQAVADALLKIFANLSLPLEVLTDCETNFVSSFMQEVYKFLGIHHVKTAPYRPQSNGSLERFLLTLLQMNPKAIQKKTDWFELSSTYNFC